MFSPICSKNLSSWKRKQISFQNSFFSQFASWKRNHGKYSLKKNIVESEFEIRVNIWWSRFNSVGNSKCLFLFCFHFLIFEFQRIELQKFAKLMRQRRPNSKLSMQYDKLIIDHEIYMFNDITGRVEEVRFRFMFIS